MANSSKRQPTHRRYPQQPEPAPGVDDQEQPVVRPKGPVVRIKRAKEMLGEPANSTFYEWLRRGEFEVIRIGRLTLLTERSVDAFLDRHTVRSQLSHASK